MTPETKLTVETTDAELARLRVDLERFTGHGLLDCHAICDQRDSAVSERDRLRADRTYNHECINRLASATGTLGEKSGTVVDVALSTIARLSTEVERLKGLASWANTCIHHNDAERARYGHVCPVCTSTRAEKAEADTARMDWLEKESPEDWGIWSIDRATIDKAMKEGIK